MWTSDQQDTELGTYVHIWTCTYLYAAIFKHFTYLCT